jgi:NO-binding membrane sensor protein with MHYT domain/nitrogen-specific signal transduction histidine kinase
MDIMHNHHHNYFLIFLSVLIAIFASYTSLDLVNSVSNSRGKIKWIWLLGGSLAMGVGIWSMHFIGMLAFSIPGLDIYYDVPLLILSIIVAILASALALYIVSSLRPSLLTYTIGSLVMGAAIAGMHYIGIASMRMGALIQWNYFLVILSILIAFAASFGALFFAFILRDDLSVRGFLFRGTGGILMGFAIAGMHYTGMAAMSFTLNNELFLEQQYLLATDGLASVIIIGTLVILGVALTGSNIDRALSRKTIMNDLLQSGIKARDEFMSITSHELRTPLTSVKLQLQLLMRQLRKSDLDKDKVISIIEKTDRSLTRIDGLVNDMLDISRITSGKLTLNKEQVDLNDILMEVIERFQPQFEDSKAGEILYTPAKAIGYFDILRIDQVVSNLLSNALKYGKGSKVEIELKSDQKYALFFIRDYGMGIPDEFKNKLFERFERAISANEVSGLGLGLFIVKEIVEAHQGKIWVESESGKGSTFFVELPLSN